MMFMYNLLYKLDLNNIKKQYNKHVNTKYYILGYIITKMSTFQVP